jgi:competence protein ComEA
MDNLLDMFVAQVGRSVQALRSRVPDAAIVSVAVALGLSLVVAGVMAWSSQGPSKAATSDPPVFESSEQSYTSTSTSTMRTGLVVHVAGAVRSPGLYRLADGSRVADAIEVAGGVDGSVDVDRVNLAAPVADGQRVFIARRGEPTPEPLEATSPVGAGGSGSATPKAPIDLNTASQQDLEALPGIGPSMAKAILDRRARVGRFSRVEDLLEVRGIGQAKLDQFRDLIAVR